MFKNYASIILDHVVCALWVKNELLSLCYSISEVVPSSITAYAWWRKRIN